jgi:hypothetical protein
MFKEPVMLAKASIHAAASACPTVDVGLRQHDIMGAI